MSRADEIRDALTDMASKGEAETPEYERLLDELRGLVDEDEDA